MTTYGAAAFQNCYPSAARCVVVCGYSCDDTMTPECLGWQYFDECGQATCAQDTSVPFHACGDYLSFYNPCFNEQVSIPILDCGPGPSYVSCDSCPSCNGCTQPAIACVNQAAYNILCGYCNPTRGIIYVEVD